MTQLPFWQPAEARAQIWRTLLGFVLILAIWFAFTQALILGASLWLGVPRWVVAQGASWITAAATFLTFAGFHIGLALTLPVLHRQTYPSLFGPARRLNLRHFALGLLATLALGGALLALSSVETLLLPDGVTPPVTQIRPVGLWLAGLVPALALIFLQVLGEEAVFRGYLLQQLRARFRSPLIWAVLPSLLFGGLHFDAGTHGLVNASAYMLNATIAGTIAAFVTLRTGNLGAAAGLHFGNNATLVLVGIEGQFSGFSLAASAMDMKSGYATYTILMQSITMVLAYLIWRAWMDRHRPIANDASAA